VAGPATHTPISTTRIPCIGPAILLTPPVAGSLYTTGAAAPASPGAPIRDLDPAATCLDRFGAAARTWFEASFDAPTPVQRDGWPRIAAGEHALLIAPTGSGKTLAAFFACIDRLTRLPPDAPPGVRVVYVSPLKALVYDIERNLRAPLAGIRRAAEARGEVLRIPRVAVRTGDTSPGERRQQGRDPADILVTTPESLYLILGSRQRETLAAVETVIVDEIHALAPTKRGAHLALSLERVAAGAARDPQRIGLSATARPAAEVARFLGGDRAVAIVDAGAPPDLDLEIRVPVPDMTRPEPVAAAAGAGSAAAQGGGLWPAIHPKLLEEIRAHRSTIVFVNSRGLCERLAQRLNELAGEDLVRAHHGSLAHAERRQIEGALKSGRLRALVATSSLELGVDMDAVDLVLLVESPGAVSRGLQRVGRAGHQVGVPSRGLVYPKHRGDLLEAVVVAGGMRRGEVEPLRVPANPLDVLAQQIVAICAAAPIELDALEARVRRAASFRQLSREMLVGVLDMLAGRYPSTDFAELRPRIHWDRERDLLTARAGARQLALVSGGTIPDRGLYRVQLGADGPRVGELDEEMVNETRAGEVITLGASSWRVEEITRDRVIVAPAPGEVGKLPFWRGDGPGRALELGVAIGAFLRELASRCGGGDLERGRAAGEAWLRERHGLDGYAARNLVDYAIEQQAATGCLPTDQAITVERFRDELGDWRVCILSPFGSRLHAPWALAIQARLSRDAGHEVEAVWSDDGIVLRLPDADDPPRLEALLPDPEEVGELVVSQLAASALFAGQFRENAARALLLPRRRPGQRTPLFAQRLRAQNLLAVAREFPSFPIVLETYRSCLQDVFDLDALVSLLRDLRSRKLRVDEVETRQASPFARSLVFAYTASFLYQGDSPVAERRAQALTLDRHMLRDLLGREELRGLLDADVIDAVEADLQARAPERRAQHPDALHDLLRRLGDLSVAELRERCEGDVEGWLPALVSSLRALSVKVGGEERWIAAEDAGLYRDALGCALPDRVPAAFLAPAPRPLEQVVRRQARQRGPFTTADLALRYGLVAGQLEEVLAALAAQEKLAAGEFHPRGTSREWCDPEVLRRLRRRTLAALRDQVAPVDARTFTRFLHGWHRLGSGSASEARLHEALAQLEGAPVSFAELERLILPARVEAFDPRLLDGLGARGEWLWIGCGAHGQRDLRIAVYRRDRAALLAEPPPGPAAGLSPLATALLGHLTSRGASFAPELSRAAGSPPQAELDDALWELACGGLATNDTFAALRALSARHQRVSPRRGRPKRPQPAPVGRWSSVAGLLAEETPATRRAHARALMLLERYGVVSRDALANESLPGGFSAVYGVYRQMEESGKLRRGHFVDALSGAQFAFAGAVDRLRAARSDETAAIALAATDPANPFGALLPWPAARAEASPRRAAGASVVIVDGELALYVERGGGVASFAPADPARAEPVMRLAAAALRQLFAHRRRRSLRIDAIDGVPAARSPWAQALVGAGFRADYKGMALDRSEAVARRS
jgi:ATP-dependent Lhr-like helicase